jgi:tRNA threonylcarbamoyl adenosine modification protein (Sua5/YciO/YrdC/YwlC family)
LGDADAQARLRRVRGMDAKHHLTLMCRDLSEIATYALVDNAQFRLLKAATPGSYTFILRATREVPRRLLHARRKSIGVRVPAHPAARALLEEMGEPMLSATLQLPGGDVALSDAQQIRAALEHQLDLVIDSGPCGTEPSTVIDLTGETPVVLRAGKGSLAVLGQSV